MAPTQKTLPTDIPPAEYLDGLADARRRDEGRALLALFAEVTRAPGVMWGPSIVGFGSTELATGGVWPVIGFSARKARLSLYGLLGHPRSEELVAALGGRTAQGVGCLYITRLDEVSEPALRELVTHSWAQGPGRAEA